MGTLHVVATPIGNLEDVTLRALRVLAEAELLFAEDTRRTRILLDRHGIAARPLSLHAHNEEARVEQAQATSRQGRDCRERLRALCAQLPPKGAELSDAQRQQLFACCAQLPLRPRREVAGRSGRAGCCATGSPSSRWRSDISIGASPRWRPKAPSSGATPQWGST